MKLDTLMLNGTVVGFTFSLFALRKLPGEPKFNLTVRFVADRDNARAKGNSLDECVAKALGGMPTGQRHILDDLIGDLTFHHTNIGVSGLARLPGEPPLFCNIRRAAEGELKMGRGHNIEEAVQEALKR